MPGVVSYRISYLSSSDHPWQAEIRCYPSEVFSTQPFALIRFYNAAPPPNSLNDGVHIVNFTLARFADVVAILREENNVFAGKLAYARDPDIDEWGLATGKEATGDMEP